MDISIYYDLMNLLDKKMCNYCNSYYNKNYLKKHINKFHKDMYNNYNE